MPFDDTEIQGFLHPLQLLVEVVKQVRRVHSLHEDVDHVDEEGQHRHYHQGLELKCKHLLHQSEVQAKEMAPNLTQTF
jgi:hypothetical protein